MGSGMIQIIIVVGSQCHLMVIIHGVGDGVIIENMKDPTEACVESPLPQKETNGVY